MEVERTLEDCRTAVNPLVSLADRDDCARQKTFSNTLEQFSWTIGDFNTFTCNHPLRPPVPRCVHLATFQNIDVTSQEHLDSLLEADRIWTLMTIFHGEDNERFHFLRALTKIRSSDFCVSRGSGNEDKVTPINPVELSLSKPFNSQNLIVSYSL